jgi:hypothetical protein
MFCTIAAHVPYSFLSGWPMEKERRTPGPDKDHLTKNNPSTIILMVWRLSCIDVEENYEKSDNEILYQSNL